MATPVPLLREGGKLLPIANNFLGEKSLHHYMVSDVMHPMIHIVMRPPPSSINTYIRRPAAPRWPGVKYN